MSTEEVAAEIAVATKVTQVLRDRGWLDSGDAADAGPEVAAHLADLLAARDRQVRAEALRELSSETRKMPADPDKAADWLRGRADRIEADA